MNFGYHSSAQPFSLASSLGPELNDLLNSQADQIKQLQQCLEARDQEFEILLSKVNGLHVTNQNQLISTAKSKGNKRNQALTPQQIANAIEQHRKNPHYKKLVSAQKKKKNQNSTPKKQHPHQLTVKETPAGFEPTKVRNSSAQIQVFLSR
ncbi:hypothetical protein O181_103064 [Austropuccinia psidii MF-1]|uniref:Uncharacterized protein n=1 Tax=Austropuccinia psidii MF-1 TaxID=1389203 RepID=A0A9Q3JKF1_9BASI|nr:hypothetical protein [Austropuccinia psidii MF-1]